MNCDSWEGLFAFIHLKISVMTVKMRILGKEESDFTPSTDLLEYQKTYYPEPPTRDAKIQPHTVTLEDNHFVQFEFDDDTVWFSSSQNIAELFPDSTIRERGTNEVTVSIPFELGRDIVQERGGGLKRVLLKIVRVFIRKKTPEQTVLELAADLEKQVLGNDPGLYSIGDDFSMTKFTAPATPVTEPYLLFIHGSLSSTLKSFGKLADTDTWRAIKTTYGDRVLGFQHKSVTDGPLKNTLDLVNALPKNCKLHVVTQSHGGVVGEVLSRFYNSVGGVKGFSPQELALFKDQPQDQATIAQIAAINTNITIEKYIRSAAPAAGTTLASDRLDRWLNLFSNLIGLVAGPLYPTIRHLIIAAIEAKNDPAQLPGLQALKSSSPFIRALNFPGGTQIDNSLVIISGRAKFFKKRGLVILTQMFFREDNDFIVNTESMYAGTPRTKSVQFLMDEGREVNHFNYFGNETTLLKFGEALLTVPFGTAIPGFTPRQILLLKDIPSLLALRARATETVNVDKLYYINVGPGGTFKPSGDGTTDTTAEDVDKIISKLKGNTTTNVLLYFHGGLVNAKSGMETAERITSLALKGNKVYPIAFVWETGLVETVGANLKELYQTELFKKILTKALKIAAKKLGINIPGAGLSRGTGQLTDADVLKELEKQVPFENMAVTRSRSANDTNDLLLLESQLQTEVQLEVNSDSEMKELIAAEKTPTEKLNLDPQLIDGDMPGVRTRGLVSTGKLVKALATVIFKTVKRFIQKRDHGFYPTVVEEIFREVYIANIGAWFWKQMKDKAAEMWLPNTTTSSNDLSQHAGTYLLRSLQDYGDAIGKNIRLDLVGHSAGSIAVAELLNVLKDYPRLEVRNVVYFAPAITSKLFNEKVVANKNRFKSFRMFTMSDEYEKKDHLVPYVYTRSLLYFISGCLENGGKESDEYVLGLARHMKDEPPYSNVPLLESVRNFLTPIAKTCVMSVTAQGEPEGSESASETHGGFDDDEGTLKSLMFILNAEDILDNPEQEKDTPKKQ